MAIISVGGGCTGKKCKVGFQFKHGTDDFCYLGGSFIENAGTVGSEKELNVKGFVYGQNYGGCRACGNKYIYQCHNCGSFNCYNGEASEALACPVCGAVGNVPKTDRVGAGAPIVRSKGCAQVILAIDVSASMDETVGYGRRTRLDEVKDAAVNSFIRALTGAKIAVVTFGDTARTELDFTSDMNAVERVVRGLSTRGKTTSPLAHIRREFSSFIEQAGANRFIVVFTDGAWNGTGHESTAQKLRDDGLSIITIGCAGADSGFLNRIATQGASITAAGDSFGSEFATAAKLVTQ